MTVDRRKRPDTLVYRGVRSGIVQGAGSPAVRFPHTQDEALVKLGHSFDHMYKFFLESDAAIPAWPAAGNSTPDLIGGIVLNANNGAAGLVPAPSKWHSMVANAVLAQGSRYQNLDAAGTFFDVLLADDLTVAMMLGLGDPAGTRSLMGRHSSGTGYYRVHHLTTGLSLLLKDDTNTSFTATISTVHDDIQTPVTIHVKRGSNVAGINALLGSATVDTTGMTALTDSATGNYAFFYGRDLGGNSAGQDMAWMAFSNNTLADPADLQARMERYFLS